MQTRPAASDAIGTRNSWYQWLHWAEFIFPPPRPSLKELSPRGKFPTIIFLVFWPPVPLAAPIIQCRVSLISYSYLPLHPFGAHARLLFLDLVTVTYILLLFYPFLLLFSLALPRGSVCVLSSFSVRSKR